MKRLLLGVTLCIGIAGPGLAQSTINPVLPASGLPYSSTPIRNNFQAAYNNLNTALGTTAKVTATGTQSVSVMTTIWAPPGAGNATFLLPASPLDNAPYMVVNDSTSGGTMTVDGNGHNIGLSGTTVAVVAGQAVSVRFSTASNRWEILDASGTCALCGTMATQSANAVAITGGAISGVNLSTVTLTGGLNLNGQTLSGNATFSGGTINYQNAGVFTDTQMNTYVSSLLNGLSPSNEYHTYGGPGHFDTEALTGGVSIPNASTVWQSSGIAGYAVNDSTTTNGVGGYFYARAAIAGTHIWSLNTIALDNGLAVINAGAEFDTNCSNASSICNGITVIGASTAQFTGNGVSVSTPSIQNPGLVKWSNGFLTQDGAAVGGLVLGAASPSGTQIASQPIDLGYYDGSAVKRNYQLQVDTFGTLNVTTSAGANLAKFSVNGNIVTINETVNGILTVSCNSTTFPASNLTTFNVCSNHSGGNGEVDFFNSQNAGGGFRLYQKTGTSTATQIAEMTTTSFNFPGLPTSAGTGGLYVCVDTAGNFYKRASCP